MTVKEKAYSTYNNSDMRSGYIAGAVEWTDITINNFIEAMAEVGIPTDIAQMIVDKATKENR